MAGDGREGWQLVCVEQTRGQRRVYMRRAVEEEGGHGAKGWLTIDDHVSPEHIGRRHTHRPPRVYLGQTGLAAKGLSTQNNLAALAAQVLQPAWLLVPGHVPSLGLT